ncbi:hypothetical protein [Paludibacterium denitrificans]|uniref:Uncharacterized protein n=1 Tax=Paludibacterium denitrificans TaxID=2675226 RepID=A0A844G8V7_9NEIS|nr:hypothetical protein [Paludibacterium denitrificans]MTD32773.1 hypothetical protein [Paludibacterium denitrificans]
MTSGSGMWRNLSNRLPVQGFDEVADQNTIIKANPAAGRSLTTGVFMMATCSAMSNSG